MDPVKNFLLSSLIIRQNLAAVSLTVCAYVGVPKKNLGDATAPIWSLF